MGKIINHLRKQPEQVRRHILHATTVIFAVILISLWVFSLGVNLTNPDTQAKINNDLKPFSTLKANLIDGYNSISGSN
jgi:hypothetical protein